MAHLCGMNTTTQHQTADRPSSVPGERDRRLAHQLEADDAERHPREAG
jgi:hypothetical protein